MTTYPARRQVTVILLFAFLALPFLTAGVLIMSDFLPLSYLPFPVPAFGGLPAEYVAGLLLILVGTCIELIGVCKGIFLAPLYLLSEQELICQSSLFSGISPERFPAERFPLARIRNLEILSREKAAECSRQAGLGGGMRGAPILRFCSEDPERLYHAAGPGHGDPATEGFVLVEDHDGRRFILNPLRLDPFVAQIRECLDRPRSG